MALRNANDRQQSIEANLIFSNEPSCKTEEWMDKDSNIVEDNKKAGIHHRMFSWHHVASGVRTFAFYDISQQYSWNFLGQVRVYFAKRLV